MALKEYAVIQTHFRPSKPRTFFASEAEAETEARDLLERKKSYLKYEAPSRLVIVKIVGVVEVASKRRALKASDTEPEEEPVKELRFDIAWPVGKFGMDD